MVVLLKKSKINTTKRKTNKNLFTLVWVKRKLWNQMTQQHQLTGDRKENYKDMKRKTLIGINENK